MSERETSRPKVSTRYSYSGITRPFSPHSHYGLGMTADPRAALASFVAALERHLEAATQTRDPDDNQVLDANRAVAQALEDYDDAVFNATGVEVPVGFLDDDDDEDDDDLDDELDDLLDEDDDELDDDPLEDDEDDDDLDDDEDDDEDDDDEDDDDDDEEDDDLEDDLDEDLEDDFEDEDDDEDAEPGR